MGMLSTIREDRANRRAHSRALKSRARLEAKLTARETRSQAKEAHQIALVTAKDQAKQARALAKGEAKRLDSSARKTAKKLDKEARKAAKTARTTARAQIGSVTADRKDRAKAHKAETKALTKQRKEEAKIVKAGRKHERAMAEVELKQMDAAKFSSKDVKRWIDVAKTAAPIAAPLIYKAVTSAHDNVPVTSSIPGVHGVAGPGAALAARTQRIGASLDKLERARGSESSVVDFTNRSRTRLTDLQAAVESAESMPTKERREVHHSISKELDAVNRDVLAHLGVSTR